MSVGVLLHGNTVGSVALLYYINDTIKADGYCVRLTKEVQPDTQTGSR